MRIPFPSIALFLSLCTEPASGFMAAAPVVPHKSLSLLLQQSTSLGFTSSKGLFESSTSSSTRRTCMLQLKKGNEDENEDGGDDIDISDRDWRAFRAQLVMGDSDTNDKKSDDDSSSSSGAQDTDAATSDAITDDLDLDGIGALFSSSNTGSGKEAPMTSSNFTPLEPSQFKWAYDAGKLIEQGAVILGGVEQTFSFGLRQQYFHKAAILVLDHDDNFTKGIILNRPTDMLLKDEFGEQWRIWFGGDVQNLNHPVPDIVCIHTLGKKNQNAKGDVDSTNDDDDDEDLVQELSTTVIQNIQRVSFSDAKLLVQKKLAKPSDFWCFAGYCGWGPNQLTSELNRNSWYMCATDSQTLLQELAKQSSCIDPRDAGLDTWELLMEMIGRGETAQECSGDFEDLMLKEWARAHLLSVEAGGSAGVRLQPEEVASTNANLVQGETLDVMMKQVKGMLDADSVHVGSLLRASASCDGSCTSEEGGTGRSPYLLENQEFHKSIVLVIGDDDNTSVGLILNQPSPKGIEMELVDRKTAVKKTLDVPVRFGGQYAIRGMSTVQWLHCSDSLREAKVGRPVGPKGNFSISIDDDNKEGDGDIDNQADDDDEGVRNQIWMCSQDDATSAISAGLARPSDFLVASGISVWIKEKRGKYQGLKGEIKDGKFEVIPVKNVSKVWAALSKQNVLTKMNFIQNLNYGNEAWKAGSGGGGSGADKDEDEDSSIPLTSGIGENYDEEDDKLVFKSDVRVAKLSDDALRSWIATFLLGAPSLGA